MFRRAKDALIDHFKDEKKEVGKEDVLRDLLRHYQRAGIEATLLHGESPDTIAQEPAIQIEGRNFDLVMLPDMTDLVVTYLYSQSDTGSTTTTNWSTEAFHFIVKQLGKRNEQDLQAEMTEEKKGLIRKKLVGLSWEGGKLARLLNKDKTLINMILKSQTSSLKVESDANNDCIRIIHTKQIKYIMKVKKGFLFSKKVEVETRFEDFPSIETFNIIDRIAEHIKSI